MADPASAAEPRAQAAAADGPVPAVMNAAPAGAVASAAQPSVPRPLMEDALREEPPRAGRRHAHGVLGNTGASNTQPGEGKLPPPVEPYTGKYREVMTQIQHGMKDNAIVLARGWHNAEPGDVMALVALGEAYEANGELDQAARAYGSIIDLFAARADLRRFAGERLEHLAKKAGLDLAIDTYAKAAKDRPDHPASHRLLAYAQLKNGHYQEAFDALATGLQQNYPENRFRGVHEILAEDLGLVAAAWAHADPSHARDILAKVEPAGGFPERGPSLRFVLNWETDANDVDFHITDAQGGHAYYSSPELPSGGRLYADVTTGYGPECFTIRGANRSSKYTLQAHYYSRGPMGYGMGKLQIIDHDGNGNLTFEERPYVVMVDHAYVNLGVVTKI